MLPAHWASPWPLRGADVKARRISVLLWVVGAALLLGFLAYLAVGANGPEDPRLAPETPAVPEAPTPAPSTAQNQSRRPVEGFGEIGFRLAPVDAGGPAASKRMCALLAESTQQVQQGLMGRSDLSGYDAMVFRFADETSGPFFMRNVPMPLEIAWFAGDGAFVSSAEMAPCEDRDGCPLYPPAGPYRYALEVDAGGLARLGVDSRSVLTLEPACASVPARG